MTKRMRDTKRRGCCKFLHYNLCCETPALRATLKSKSGVFIRGFDVTLMRTPSGKISLVADRQGFIQALLARKSRSPRKK